MLPDMSRHGVMNHLRVLEDGGLVTTHRDGRQKLHFLNRVPIRQIHDRWISKYTEHPTALLAAMTDQLQGAAMTVPSHVYQTYIDCEPAAAWNAIVDGSQTQQYFYGTKVESDWEVGSEIRYVAADGSVVADGEILAIDAPNRVEMRFRARWDPALEALGPARQAWSVGKSNGLTTVTVEFYDLADDDARIVDFMDGIPLIVAGMKTLLETGSPIGSRS